MALEQWAGSVIAAALLCGILLSLAGQGFAARLLRLVCGVVLAWTALSPLKQLELPQIASWQEDFTRQGEAAAEAGAEMAQRQRCSSIKQTLEAYIMKEAADRDARITARITLTPEGSPEAAVITGTFTASQKEQLTRLMETQLGICREEQQWIGCNGGLS